MSVRWLIARDNVTDVDIEGFRFVEKRNSFSIFENENYIPMGFIYDRYVDKEGFENTSESLRDRLLVKAIYLSDEQIKKYGGLYEKLDTSATWTSATRPSSRTAQHGAPPPHTRPSRTTAALRLK